ncbi:MAG: MotA/TolQ/ExbB proton channel family protein [Planctomycetaceae bacterium]|nr:MotA/TolQ/ExbB proton channel family protein [Planctomycetaceae bacterium]
MFRSLFLRIAKSSILWGGLVGFVFFAMIHNGVIKDSTIIRYCAMHPIEYSITIMFFIGMAGLAIKFFDVRRLWGRTKAGPILEPFGEQRIECRETPRLLRQVAENVKKHGESLHAARLKTILNNIHHADSAEKLDDDLRCLADDEYSRAESDYGLTKMIIWAIPILGFLGTVVGIAMAMAELAPQALEESLPKVMEGLTVAFDTTALALALSMVVYFSQFLLWRDEQKLLDETSRLVDAELRGRFVLSGASPGAVAGENEQLVTVRMMLEVVLETLQDLIQKQAYIWDQAMSASHSRYAMMASESATQMKSTLAVAIRENVEVHARELARAEQKMLQESKQYLREMVLAEQEAIRESSKQMQESAKNIAQSFASLGRLQIGMQQQAEVLRDVIKATGEITRLEDRLNQNLVTLAETRYFEETLNSLAAAIHLLNTKHGNAEVPQVKITARKTKNDKAA